MFFRLACFILLVACAPSDRLLRTYSHDTGIWQTVSRDTEVFRDGRDHMSARTIILESGAEARYFLSLSVLRGGPNEPRILAISKDGQPVNYEMHDRLRTFCIDRCHKAEVGQIRLTQAEFRRAANGGMTLKIDGLRRNYTARVPARLFYSALRSAGLLEPTRKPLP